MKLGYTCKLFLIDAEHCSDFKLLTRKTRETHRFFYKPVQRSFRAAASKKFQFGRANNFAFQSIQDNLLIEIVK